MPLIMVIAAFALISVSDATESEAASTPWSAAAWAFIVPLLGAAALAIAVCLTVRQLDRTGNLRSVARVRALTHAYRIACLAAYAFAITARDWPGVIRGWIGDPPALDELFIATPIWLALTASFAAAYPIDRRMREALLLRHLEAGTPIHPIPSLVQSVSLAWRHQVLFILLPLTMITAWAESAVLLARAIDLGELAVGALQLGGTFAVLAVSPLSLRFVWDTVRVGDGELRNDLLAMCRLHKVRISGLLVWRTGGAVVNAAVAGFLPIIRFVVISDALLESMPKRAVEGVAAHEIAHVKHHHLAWLAATVLAAVTVIGTPLGWLAALAWFAGVDTTTATAAVGAITLAGALVVMGFVSRRFERQADAFAVRHLTRAITGPDADTVTEDAAGAMQHTLGLVASLNGMNPTRFAWRHGSINERERRIASLVGQPVDRLPIDREVIRWKLAIAAGLALATILVVLDSLVAHALTQAVAG